MTAPIPATPLIDWHALVQVLYTSVALALGLVVIFSIGVYSLSLYRRSDSTIALRSLSVTAMGLVTLVILAVGVWGLIVIVNK
jgi:hypothetical protein